MKKTAAILTAAAVLASVLNPGAVWAETENEAKDSREEITLNVAYMPNYAALWAVLTGVDKGYFEDEGLKLNLYEFADGPTEIAAMESGSIDLAYIGHGAHKLCINGKAKIFAIQQVNDDDSIVVVKDHGIEKLEDLKGKKVGYTSGTSSESSLRSALNKAGLTWDDIQAYEMDATNMVTAMVSGTVDACATWSPYNMEIVDQVDSAEKISFDADTVSIASWIALPDYADENEDVIERFTKALYKAYDYGSQEENYKEVAQLVADQCKTDFDTAYYQTEDATWYNQELIRNGLEDGSIRDLYQKQQDSFIKDGQVEKEVPLDDYILFDNMKNALSD